MRWQLHVLHYLANTNGLAETIRRSLGGSAGDLHRIDLGDATVVVQYPPNELAAPYDDANIVDSIEAASLSWKPSWKTIPDQVPAAVILLVVLLWEAGQVKGSILRITIHLSTTRYRQQYTQMFESTPANQSFRHQTACGTVSNPGTVEPMICSKELSNATAPRLRLTNVQTSIDESSRLR